MNVPFNNLGKEYLLLKKETDGVMRKVAKSGWYILGNEVKVFEDEFAKFLGAKHAIGVANGLEALQIALMALEIKPGDEVITTPLSAAATTLSIVAIGAKPVFVDVDEFLHIDAKKIEKAITKKTKAIMPVHLYGNATDMEKITKIAKKYKLEIIEDCAQAHGAEFKNKKLGTFGIAGAFSFYPTKNLGALGDGGAIVTNNSGFADKCKMIRNYGQKNRYEHLVYGINSRLDEIQAAILRVKLKRLDKNNNKRRKIAEIYTKELSKNKNIKIVGERKNSKSVWHLFVVEVERRDELQKYLKERGVDTLIHYPIPLHKQELFKEYNHISLPTIEERAQKILSLPINPYLTDAQIKYVSHCIKEFLG